MAKPAKASRPDPAELAQDARAFDQSSKAIRGAGQQYVYFGDRDRPTEATISVAPPYGQRANLPLRGRDQLLAVLTDPRQACRVHVVHGLGGCGKTRLALEVAHLAEQARTEVWWVPATDESTFLSAMHAVGRRLGVTDAELAHGDAADVIWRRLHGRGEPWLLVIDNADDPSLLAGAGSSVADGLGWLRPVHAGAAGRGLVPSREGSRAVWSTWCLSHRLGMLADAEAGAVLADYAGHRASLGTEEEAESLAARLGGLPLALKIAGSYLAESAEIPAAFAEPGTITTYLGYRDAIDPAGEHLSQDQALSLIGRTWDLTLDRLDGRVPEARELLRLLSCLADAPIPYELL